MRNIVLVGGMGVGKTTLAKRMCEFDESIFHLEGSKYGVKISMTLGLDPSGLSKRDYIEEILNHENIPLDNGLKREDMDEYFLNLHRVYGSTFFGEFYSEILLRKNRQGVIDNCPLSSNIAYLKKKGFYVVSLEVDKDIQLNQCLERKKNIDPISPDDMKNMIMENAKNFGLEESMALADYTLNLSNIDLEKNKIMADGLAYAILKRTSL